MGYRTNIKIIFQKNQDKEIELKVKLVSYSKPDENYEAEGLGNVQDLIAFCARVSNPANQMNTETSAKLLNYLAKHKHWSPFEIV